LDTPFQGLLLGKVWTTTTDLGSQRWGWLGPPNFNGGRPQILDQISKITPISDLLSYKGCLSIERPWTFGAKEKKTSVEKQNTSFHTTCGWRHNNKPARFESNT